jgi:hypothetical protein
MASRQELQVQKKREQEAKEETTMPARVFPECRYLRDAGYPDRHFGNARCRKK